MKYRIEARREESKGEYEIDLIPEDQIEYLQKGDVERKDVVFTICTKRAYFSEFEVGDFTQLLLGSA